MARDIIHGEILPPVSMHPAAEIGRRIGREPDTIAAYLRDFERHAEAMGGTFYAVGAMPLIAALAAEFEAADAEALQIDMREAG
ncbi:MAG: hypothetical protein ACQEUZ_06345 [Pseudomonadota bacterium]